MASRFQPERIRARRGQLKMSAAALGDRIGRHMNTVYSWEKGAQQPSADDLASLARVLGVPVAYFYGERSSA